MELIFYVPYLIIFTILGINGDPNILGTCDKYNEKFCKCSDVDRVEEIQVKMCSYKEDQNEYCKPCHDYVQDNVPCTQCPDLTCAACNINFDGLVKNNTSVVQDNATCADCLELNCPTCNISSFGFSDEKAIAVEGNATCVECLEITCPACNFQNLSVRFTNEQTTGVEDNVTCVESEELMSPENDTNSIEMRNKNTIKPTVKHKHRHQNSRKLCKIDKKLFDQRFVCNVSRDKTECVLPCSKEDVFRNKGYSYNFSCKRKKNVWKIKSKSCAKAQSENGSLQSTVKHKHRHQNSRKLCQIDKKLFDQRFVCNVRRHKTKCEMPCSKENVLRNNGYSYHFSCKGKKNVWKIGLKSCAKAQSKSEKRGSVKRGRPLKTNKEPLTEFSVIESTKRVDVDKEPENHQPPQEKFYNVTMTDSNKVKSKHRLQNQSKGPHIENYRKLCAIDKTLFDRRFVCNVWAHKTKCVLPCSKKDMYRNSGYSYHFRCKQKRNVWKIKAKSCAKVQGKNKRRDSVKREKPLKSNTEAITGFSVFESTRNVDVEKGHDNNQPPQEISYKGIIQYYTTCANCLKLKCPTCILNSVVLTDKETVHIQDNASCVECLEIACPECNFHNFSVRFANEQITKSMVKSKHRHRHQSKRLHIKNSRRLCPIDKKLFDRRFVCNISRHEKNCVMACSKEDTLRKGHSYQFSCKLKKNIWKVEVKPCTKAKNENERRGFDNQGKPLKTSKGPITGFGVFEPTRGVDIDKEHDNNHPSQEKSHNDNEISSTESLSYLRKHNLSKKRVFKRSYDFDYDDEILKSLMDEIMARKHLNDYKLVEPKSSWKMHNESSLSYAPKVRRL